MKYFKKRINVGNNKEKLWAEVLKIFYRRKIRPAHHTGITQLVQELRSKGILG